MKKIMLMAIFCLGMVSVANAQAPKVTAFNQYNEDYSGELACDGDMETRWATQDYTDFKDMWLEMDYRKEMTFSKVAIEEYQSRITRFQIQYKVGEEWKVAYEGTKIGQGFEQSFPAVTSRYFRLVILERADKTWGPSIWEIELKK